MLQAGECCLPATVGPGTEDIDPGAEHIGSQGLAKPLEALCSKP